MDKELPCRQFLELTANNQSIKLTDAARLYLDLKGKDKGVTFYNLVQRATRYIIKQIGDKNLAS